MGYSAIWKILLLSMVFRICDMVDGELGPANSTSLTPSCRRPSIQCANLNISYPFWDSASCALSPNFVLSNCSSSSAQYAHWDSLSDTLQAAVPGDPPPTAIITDISTSYQGYSAINLTWDASLLTMDVCASLFTSQNFSQFNIPASVNLTGFAEDAFDFKNGAYINVYLFFNCTNNIALSRYVNSTAQNWEKDSEYCNSHREICRRELSTSSCISLVSPHKELRLLHDMDTLACSHFTFGIVEQPYPPLYDTPFYTLIPWYIQQRQHSLRVMSTGLVQLYWADSKCTSCEAAGGFCVYQDHTLAKSMSYCRCHSGRIDPRKQTCQPEYPENPCYGGLMQCNHTFQICLGVGLLVVALLLAFPAFFYFGKIRKAFLALYFGKIRKAFHDLSSTLTCLTIHLLKKLLSRLQKTTYRPNLSIILRELEGLTERPVEYSYSSIASATKSFTLVVGEGGFGVVYKGTLSQCSSTKKEGKAMEIAVKVLQRRSKHMKKQFLNEVATIGRIHHVNVVRLLGFCVEYDHEMLVYEYVANGSLDRWLFAGKNGGNDEKQVLDWSQRYAIALGVARGLSYLHEECRHRTVHCDIKPQNILLDEEMSPKIADFGLSRLMGREESHVVTLARGTPGYMAPEFWRGGESMLSTKFDVYSYGMVLLELISGRLNFAQGDANRDSLGCFPAVAFEAAMQGNMGAILDPRLGTTEQASQVADGAEVWNATFVALWCIQDHPASRPAMSEVVQYLEGTISISKNPPQPSISTTPAVIRLAITSHDRQEMTPISVGR